MIRLTIGKGLDRAVAGLPGTALGHMTVGPVRLLAWLESELGLALPEVSFTTRMVQYLACLRAAVSAAGPPPGSSAAADPAQRFYARSLEQDEFGTARTLLEWRDAWYEAGWTGEPFGDAPDNASGSRSERDSGAGADGADGGSARLRDMAAVERLARQAVAPGLGQRVQRVLAAIANSQPDAGSAGSTEPSPLPGIDARLLDPPESFPKAWQQLFAALGARPEPWQPEPGADDGTDLGQLQRALVADRAPGRRVTLAGDGTLLVLRDGSPQLSAPWIARFAHECNTTDGAVALLAMQHGTTLDDALADAGQPRLGYAQKSHRRPVFQVLPLTLELVWRPLDPAVLVQFLTHPMAPIPASIRRRLAGVVVHQPGMGGDDWNAAVEAALAAAVASEPDESQRARRDELAAAIEDWLGGERFDPEAGSPVAFLVGRVRRVSRWLAGAFAAQADEAEAALYSAALGQADELARILERIGAAGTERLTRVSLRRLVEAVRGTGVARPDRSWQCVPGAPQLLRAETPAGFTDRASTVIWWGCDHERLPGPHPWSRAEQTELARHGVEPVPVNVELAWQARSWLRPILAARERLVLVLHDNADGHHPVFDEIVAVAEGWAEARVGDAMRDPAALPDRVPLPPTRSVAPRTLPDKARWWQLPDGVALPTREQESYSSLEKFLYGPHRWVLDYAARIRPGALEPIDDGPLLRGNLAHALFERYFAAHGEIASLEPGAAARWARAEARTLIEQQGAVLLAPGRQAETEQFVGMASNALRVLVTHLKSARVATVEMETELEGRFAGGALRGTVDLIATKASGETAVLDLKWGGYAWRREMLAKSNYLQLAIYAQLVHQNRGQWPQLGYFVVSDARIAMLASDFFPDADVEYPADGENVLQFWQRVEHTWRWRRAQLDAGLIEVPVTDTEPDETVSQPGERGLPMPDTFDRYDDYRVLTGWEPDE